jgi:hypothetical protein
LKKKKATKILEVVSQRIETILKVIEQYMSIINVAIRHHPGITALVWAGVRLTTQARALNYLLKLQLSPMLDTKLTFAGWTSNLRPEISPGSIQESGGYLDGF